ncbi:ketoacyl-ACP synthase III [bacterium]|nr:ketoacyl-ACP synthase III [bacterium]
MRSKILGTGSKLPEGMLSNADLEKIIDTSDEWIKTRSGVSYRRLSDKNTPTSELAYEASKRALEMAGIDAEELDAILVGTVTPDHAFPSTACILQHKLGARKVLAYDFSAGCTGFIYGLKQADAMIRSGYARYVLIVGVEELTKILNWTDRGTCFLFGDGAGAAVVGPSDDNSGIKAIYTASDGSLGYLLYQPAGGTVKPASLKTAANLEHTIVMYGNEVFKHAVRQMEEAALKGLELSGLSMDELDWLIPHQANIRIIDFLARRLKLPMEKVVVTIDKYGNTSAASIPISLDEAVRDGRIKSGQNVLMVAFGAGFTWGSVMVTM